MTKKIVIYVETNFRLFFSEEILGKKYAIKINGRNFDIHTPINKNETIGWLSAPNGYEIHGDYVFGYKYESNSDKISIDTLIIETLVDEHDEVETFNSLSEKIDEYLKIFDSWAIVLSGQIFIDTQVKQEYKKDMFWSANNERLAVSPGACVECYLSGDMQLITNDLTKSIIKAIETTRDFVLELEYYRSALLEYRHKRFANCVLCAATASEIYVRKKIKERLTCTSEDEKKAIMDGMHGLGSLYSFAKKIGCDIPKTNHSSISKPRNKAIHEGLRPSRSDAEKALIETRKILAELLV